MSKADVTKLLDQKIHDGYKQFVHNHSRFYQTPYNAYIQGYLDGTRSNINELVEAYQLPKILAGDNILTMYCNNCHTEFSLTYMDWDAVKKGQAKCLCPVCNTDFTNEIKI